MQIIKKLTKKTFKSMIVLLLCISFILGSLNKYSLLNYSKAIENPGISPKIFSMKCDLKTTKNTNQTNGSEQKIRLGKYDWILLKDFENEELFLLSDTAINQDNENKFNKNNIWKNSYIREYLNDDSNFFAEGGLNEFEKGLIKETDTEKNIKDKFFILSESEIKSLDCLKDNATNRSINSNWWLRSTSKIKPFINKSGEIDQLEDGKRKAEDMTVRPACKINTQNLIFTSSACHLSKNRGKFLECNHENQNDTMYLKFADEHNSILGDAEVKTSDDGTLTYSKAPKGSYLCLAATEANSNKNYTATFEVDDSEGDHKINLTSEQLSFPAGIYNYKVWIEKNIGPDANSKTVATIPQEKIQQFVVSNLPDLSVVIFNVGNGDSILISCEDHNILIDAASSKDFKDNAKANKKGKITKYFEDKKINQFDMVIATHPHADHISGMTKFFSKFGHTINKFIQPIKTISSNLYNKMWGCISKKFSLENMLIPLKKNDAIIKLPKDEDTNTIQEITNNKVKTFSPGSNESSYNIGKMKIELLAPISINSKQDNHSVNNASIVTKITYGEKSFLLEGDAEIESEKEMIKKYKSSPEILKANVIKLGHHGSDTATSNEFLDIVKPEYAAISVDKKDNKYKFPSAPTTNKLKDRSIKTYRTDEYGNITFTTNGKNIEVSCTNKNKSA